MKFLSNAQKTRSRGAVIVTRVSTGEQAKHGTSLESQRDACRAKSMALGLPIVAEYEDAGISGAFLRLREGMQSALADIEAGRADTLICANLSRYSRDVEHQQQIKKAVQNAGGHLVFCDMDFDDTPEGDLAFGVMGTFAEYERKVIRARTMRGKRKRAEEGQQPQRSRSPYGYHIVTKADILRGEFPAEMLGRYVVDDAKAALALRIFSEYASGKHGLSLLARAFNQEHIPTPGNGRSWREATLRVILSNPVYKGEPVSGRQKCGTDESRLQQFHKLTGRPITTPEVRRITAEDQWIKLSAPALVSEETWNAVQTRLTESRTYNSGNPRQVQMLSGKTICPHCGGKTTSKYQTSNGKPYRYFVCALQKDARYQFGDKPCRGDLYPVALMEAATLTALQGLWLHPQALRKALNAYRAPRVVASADPRRELTDIDRVLKQLEGEEAATVQAQIAGIQAGASPHAYTAVFADLAARRKDLENRRGELATLAAPRKKTPAQAEDEAALLTRAAEDAWRVLSSPDVPGVTKRDILSTVIEKVICRKDGADVVFAPRALQAAGPKTGEGKNEVEQLSTRPASAFNLEAAFSLTGRSSALDGLPRSGVIPKRLFSSSRSSSSIGGPLRWPHLVLTIRE